MPSDTEFELRPRDVRASFNRSAPRYDEYAFLQREIGDRLIDRLGFMRLTPALVVDLGAGTGYCARRLEQQYPQSRVLLIDLASDMLTIARRQARRWFSRLLFMTADAAQLAVHDSTADLVFSNLMLQWCDGLNSALSECRRVLRPGGLLLFSTLGPDTLRELRTAWAAVDETPHVNRFLDMHDVGDALVNAGFSSPVLDREFVALTYADAVAVMRDLKGIGAHNVQAHRARGLFGKQAFSAFTTAYEQFRVDGRLPSTYEVIFGHAWAPTATTRPQDGSTVATFPFKNLKRRDS
ncbi:MAG: malonyl-ACP O-methyltransferase BioC [Gammaproteobacteria bacterium]|nr:malonyl-ACP O-methyltransferase BioC [Gammaproteobacteria bacterium]